MKTKNENCTCTTECVRMQYRTLISAVHIVQTACDILLESYGHEYHDPS